MRITECGDTGARQEATRALQRSRFGAALQGVRYRWFSDRELVRRAGARDHTAFNVLRSRYRTQVDALKHGPRVDDDHDEAALRDTLVSAFRGVDSFAVCCTPGTWLYLNGLRAAFGRLGAAERAGSIKSAPHFKAREFITTI